MKFYYDTPEPKGGIKKVFNIEARPVQELLINESIELPHIQGAMNLANLGSHDISRDSIFG